MQQENYNQDIELDALTDLIRQRLGEREYILNRMQEMESPRQSNHHILIRTTIGLAMAACVAAVLILQPFASVSPLDELSINQPSLAELRGASEDIAEIEHLMDIPDYEAALAKTEKALNNMQMQIDEFEDIYETADEETEYETILENTQLSQLRWTYIYILVKQGQNKKAIKELKKYLKASEYAEHTDEAKKLLEKLQNK